MNFIRKLVLYFQYCFSREWIDYLFNINKYDIVSNSILPRSLLLYREKSGEYYIVTTNKLFQLGDDVGEIYSDLYKQFFPEYRNRRVIVVSKGKIISFGKRATAVRYEVVLVERTNQKIAKINLSETN